MIKTLQPIKFDQSVGANITRDRYITENLGGLPNESLLEEQWEALPDAIEGKPLRCVNGDSGWIPMEPQRFYMNRLTDATGVSGTGRVLTGMITPGGKVVIEWKHPFSTIGVYDNFKQFLAIHVDFQPESNEVIFID